MNTEENHIFDAAELRKQAEELARSREAEQPLDFEAMTPEETRKVLHELHVHQIELEMQNSELRKAQMELATEQQRYFDLYDLAPVGYCSISEQGLILKANLMVATLLGVNRGALVKQRFSQFILKDDQDNYYLHRKQLFKNGEPQSFELQMVKADGTPFWAQLEAVAAQNDDGESTCRVVISDISERKRSDELLRESELRFRSLADNGQALIWTATPDKLCDYFNEPWLAFTGRTLEQEVGNGWADGVHPDDFSRCLEIYVTAFDARQSFSMEYRLRHHSGEYRWIVDSGTPRHDSQGEFLGYIGHCLDIDGIKQAEALLIVMKDKAEVANRAKSEFLANMS
ncbi:MAG: PAS domain S-box protein, partial [Proteobacteria bacterium]|nr:PAS domain S-box protein [Pseudomonadota bacterium]